MKKIKNIIVAVLLVSFVLIATGCGRPKTIDGVTYDTVGILSEKNPNIHYEPCWGNIIWGAITFETVIGPIYFYGFSCMNPVGYQSNYVAGVVSK